MNSTNDRKGFTLIEGVVALAVFAVVTVGIFQWLRQGLITAEETQDLNRVTHILQYQVENLRSNKWSDLEVKTGNRTIPVDKNGVPGETSTDPPYDWQAFELKQFITSKQVDLYHGKLTATWTDRRGKEHTQTFETWFTDNGLNAYYTRSL